MGFSDFPDKHRDATAGEIVEYISSDVAKCFAVPLTAATLANIASVSLTPAS
jgi:hypothetical protein